MEALRDILASCPAEWGKNPDSGRSVLSLSDLDWQVQCELHAASGPAEDRQGQPLASQTHGQEGETPRPRRRHVQRALPETGQWTESSGIGVSSLLLVTVIVLIAYGRVWYLLIKMVMPYAGYPGLFHISNISHAWELFSWLTVTGLWIWITMVTWYTFMPHYSATSPSEWHSKLVI